MTNKNKESSRLPEWIRVQGPSGNGYLKTHSLLKNLTLHTVCQEARCPNIGECFEHRTATFMILGNICTRACGFCAVKKGKPESVDFEEPQHIAEAVFEMGMKHVVITSVDRDDLEDGGAEQFAQVVFKIKEMNPQTRVEILTPDFQGNKNSLKRVLEAPVDVFNHNLEMVPRLYATVRPNSNYVQSLRILQWAKELNPKILTKSGLMLGLGETSLEVLSVFSDLNNVGCDILTLGQYLRPTMKQVPVRRMVSPKEFMIFKEEAGRFGFKYVESGPLVRSSYHAWKHSHELLK